MIGFFMQLYIMASVHAELMARRAQAQENERRRIEQRRKARQREAIESIREKLRDEYASGLDSPNDYQRED